MQIELTSLITAIKDVEYDSDQLQIVPDSFEISNGTFVEMANPRYSRGASGVVFFAEGRNGQSLAIRFPLGNLPNSEYWSRMRLISNLLSKKSNYHKGREFIVPFEVVDRAILVNGEWIPAIVMPNLRDCKSLGDRVKEYYGMGMKDKLLEISKSLSDLGIFLESSGWDHGDISPGNIMVSSNGEIYLIDPDTLRNSGIPDSPITEMGHPCCSHPRRSGLEMEEDLFLFPLSLLILQVDYLSSKIGQHSPIYPEDDDEILISEGDLQDPKGSELFQRMAEEGFHEDVEKILKACNSASIPEANQILNRFRVENPIPKKRIITSRNPTSLGTFKARQKIQHSVRRAQNTPLKIPEAFKIQHSKSTPQTSSNPDIERVLSEVGRRFADGRSRHTSKIAKRISDKTGINIKETARKEGLRGFVDILNNSALDVYYEGTDEDPHVRVAILTQ